MNGSRMIASALALLATSAILAFPVPADPATCDRGSCNARITISIWTGQPALDCGGDTGRRIVVAVCCPGQCTSTQTFYRCPSSSEPYQFTGCGVTHTVSLTAGASWEEAAADCELVVYSAQ